MRTEFAKLIKQVKKDNPEADLDLIRRAYRVADAAHQSQTRLSGEPYITHSLEVAGILAGLHMDAVTLSAALLHDVLEDTDITLSDLREDFGDQIAALVDGVTKIGTMHMGDVPPTHEEKQAENLRKMLVATAKDVRVILIKLADRLHNLRTVEYLPQHKQERMCRESLDIYVPLANRLGLSRWKWELEDHAFHRLYPAEYREIASLVAMKRRDREALLSETIAFMEERLREAEVIARVIGRPKHLYGIYSKMVRQGKTFDQVTDVLAVRIITRTVGGCYNALGVVHHIWRPIPGHFKDYIATPKLNMYQSVHTAVTLPNGKPLEIQIRSDEMDRVAQEGIAAHWKYKDGVGRVDEKAEHQLQWLRQMYDWLQDAQAPDELFDSMVRDINISEIYAYTPRGEVKELPQGATPLDFAYSIHTDIGHQCIGARVNGSMVPLRYNLQTGDVVEIVTSRKQTPHTGWLDLVVTGRARTRIRQKLRELGDLPQLGSGMPRPTAPSPAIKPRPRPVVHKIDEAARAQQIRVDGTKDLKVQFANCCKPMPGHAVIGYITKRQGITVHRADCSLLGKTERDAKRMLAASWEGDEPVSIRMRVSVGARPNVLADLTTAIRPMNIDITEAELRPGENGSSVFEFVFQTLDPNRVDRVVQTLRTVSGVTQVTQIELARSGEGAQR